MDCRDISQQPVELADTTRTQPDSKKIISCKTRLESLLLENGRLQISVAPTQLPHCLVEANDALTAGQLDRTKSFLDHNAVETVHKIVEKDPSRTDVMFVLAKLFAQTGQFEKARHWYEKILTREQNPLIYNELGLICQYLGLLTLAEQYQRKAIQIAPDDPQLWPNLAVILIETGRAPQGIELLHNAVEKMPGNSRLHSSLLFYLHFLPELNQKMLFDEHRKWSRIYAPPSLTQIQHPNVPEPDRRLRIAYVSPDFSGRPVSYFIEPVLEAHNRKAFEIYGYGNMRTSEGVTEILKKRFGSYRSIYGLDDQMVAGLIKSDRIDVLIELAGHTTDNSLTVLAGKPAPVQVTYLGSPDTTGLEQIDYRLTDKFADPPGSEKFYTEELVCLPTGLVCYRPPDPAPALRTLSAIKNGYVTFGSFNRPSKIHPHMIELWAQILKACPGSRLVLKFGVGTDLAVTQRYLEALGKFGIDHKRIAVHGWLPRPEQLLLQSQIDIALDTFPFNGFTVTCETLWMGVPVISLVGDCHASRIGLSILSQIGLEFFAASTPAEYVAKAVSLAHNLKGLSKIRASIRERMKKSPLCDPTRFVKGLESAYRSMWHRWCQKQTHSSK
jgi:predicted O-linked N-acetylglucosamine transferase (SPINDLY family)